MPSFSRLGVFAGLLVVMAQPLSGQDINTIGNETGSRGLVIRGPSPFHQLWGQTFTAPTEEHFLESFSFGLSWDEGGTYRGILMAWDGTQPTGPVLYSSDIRPSGPTRFWVEQFETAIDLTPGGVYAAFIAAESGSVYVTLTGQQYDGGDLFCGYNSEGSPTLADQTWCEQRYNSDASFAADFSNGIGGPGPVATPEPLTLTLVGTGLAGIAARRRRRTL